MVALIRAMIKERCDSCVAAYPVVGDIGDKT